MLTKIPNKLILLEIKIPIIILFLNLNIQIFMSIEEEDKLNILPQIDRGKSAPPIMDKKVLDSGLFAFQSKYGHLFGVKI
jgi:hypothetical protein